MRYDVGRHEINHASNWTKQQSTLQRMAVHAQSAAFLPRVGLATRLVANQLDRKDHSSLADFSHMRMVFQLAREPSHVFCQRTVAYQNIVVSENPEGLHGGRAGERIACETVRMEKRVQLYILVVKGRVDVFGRHDSGKRQVAPGQPLRQAYEIRTDACLLTSEQGARPSEPN